MKYEAASLGTDAAFANVKTPHLSLLARLVGTTIRGPIKIVGSCLVLVTTIVATAVFSATDASGAFSPIADEPSSSQDGKRPNLSDRRRGVALLMRGQAPDGHHTPASVMQWLGRGVDGFVFPLRRTADGVLIVSDAERIEDAWNGFGWIPKTTWSELRHYHYLDPIDGRTTPHRAVRFDQLLPILLAEDALFACTTEDPEAIPLLMHALESSAALPNLVALNAPATTATVYFPPGFRPLPLRSNLTDPAISLSRDLIRRFLQGSGTLLAVDEPRLVLQLLGRTPLSGALNSPSTEPLPSLGTGPAFTPDEEATSFDRARWAVAVNPPDSDGLRAALNDGTTQPETLAAIAWWLCIEKPIEETPAADAIGEIARRRLLPLVRHGGRAAREASRLLARDAPDSTDEIVPTLLETLENRPEPGQLARGAEILDRQAAAAALGELGPSSPKVRNALFTMVEEPSFHALSAFHGLDAVAAARALGRVGLADEVERLVDRVTYVDPRLVTTAHEWRSKGLLSFEPGLWDHRLRREILLTVGRHGGPVALSSLSRLAALSTDVTHTLHPKFHQIVVDAMLATNPDGRTLLAWLDHPLAIVRASTFNRITSHARRGWRQAMIKVAIDKAFNPSSRVLTLLVRALGLNEEIADLRELASRLGETRDKRLQMEIEVFGGK